MRLVSSPGDLPAGDVFALGACEMCGGFVGAVLVWLHFLPQFKTLPEPPSADPLADIVRTRDYVTRNARQLASYNTHPPVGRQAGTTPLVCRSAQPQSCPCDYTMIIALLTKFSSFKQLCHSMVLQVNTYTGFNPKALLKCAIADVSYYVSPKFAAEHCAPPELVEEVMGKDAHDVEGKLRRRSVQVRAGVQSSSST